jgi:hypothetical protein
VNYDFLASQINACIDTSYANHFLPPSAIPKYLIGCATSCIVTARDIMQYVALSFVWGKEISEANGLLAGELKQLPRTIADAITITLRLGKQCLWVDRYCIDQNDIEAKIDEINNMGGIYASAWVTIVSLTSSIQNGIPGASAPRKLSEVHTSQGTIYKLRDMFLKGRDIRESPWAKRGWTFQEAALSKRLLFFTPEQAYLLSDERVVEEWEAWMEDFGPPLHGETKSGALGFGFTGDSSDILGSFGQYVQ